MKVNIKGLVFTGFAAAILSANAMAANDPSAINTVTSKSYVDSKVVDSLETNYDSKAPSTASVNTALANKQIKTTGQVYKVGYNETWASIDSAVKVPASGSYLTMDTSAGDGSVTLNVNAMTDSGFSNVDDTQTEGGTANANKLPTAAAVKGYVDSAIDAVSGADGLAGKQDITADNSGFVVGDSEGTWASVSEAVLNGSYVTKSVNESTGAVTIGVDATTNSALTESAKIPTAGTVKDYVDAADSALDARVDALESTDAQADWTETDTTAFSYIQNKPTLGAAAPKDVDLSVSSSNSTSTNLPTTAAVYDYVQGITNGNNIPARDPSVCDTSTYDNAPCALVAEADGLHWRTMATANHAGGVLGDAQ